MDIDFLVQDTYSLTRPQWTLVTDLDEASRIFGEAVAQNFKPQEEKPEPEEESEDSGSDDDLEEDAFPEADEEGESSDEADVSEPAYSADQC